MRPFNFLDLLLSSPGKGKYQARDREFGTAIELPEMSESEERGGLTSSSGIGQSRRNEGNVEGMRMHTIKSIRTT